MVVPELAPDLAPDVALFDSPPICDCAAANPLKPTTAATATVANSLFFISRSPLFSRKAEPRPPASRNAVTRLTPCAHRSQRGGDIRGSGKFLAAPYEVSATFRNSAHARQVSRARQIDCLGQSAMDWNRIEGNWKGAKGKIKQKRDQLNDDDLA
jgi:hypothetical protein